ncbi:MAG: hypothetical protein ACOCUV_00035 [bacterium]
MYKNTKNISSGIILFCLFIALVSQNPVKSQNRISSPYAMYGLGELYFNNNFRNMGMGGLAIGFQNNTSVNYTNPASYVGLDTNSFVFETIIFSHFYGQKTAELEQMSNYSSLGSITYGFPVFKWWSSAFGLTPYSNLGYKVKDEGFIDPVGAIDFEYEGEGGIHQVFWGNAFNLGKGFSLGLNASYLFGNLKDASLVSSAESNFFLANQHRNMSVSGFMLNFGAQYKRVLSDDKELIVGATFGNQTNLSATETVMQRIYLPGYTAPDTVLYYVNEEGKMELPANYAVGFTMKFNENWMAGADFYNQNWKQFELFGSPGNLNNSYQFAAGTQYNPSQTTYSGFFSRMRYSAGLRYKQTFIVHNDNTVNELGISFGLGFKLRQSLSGMHLSFEWANRGSIENNNLKEDLYRINLGINIHERWFVKRKFY